MENRRRFISFWRPPVFPPNGVGERPEELKEIEARMKHTLLEALERRESMSQVLAHSRRVAAIAVELGDELGLTAEELELIRRAAELHEIGMLAIPTSLLTRRSRLSNDELVMVRSHVKLGAEMVRAGSDADLALLIEQQYEDFEYLTQKTIDSREVLLSGILRVSDVFDAVTTPRPYQLPMEAEEWREVIRSGSGTKFHPAAVLALLRWAERIAA